MALPPRWLTLAKIGLDSGTRYVSGQKVTHPSWTYEGRVQKWGIVDRSIPSPCGMPQVGDARLRVIDTDHQLKDILAHETPVRRYIETKLMQAGNSESATDPFYRGEVKDFQAGPGFVEFLMRDRTFSWIDEKFPNLINRINFPGLAEGVDDQFFPVVQGANRSPLDNPQGVIRLPHIGFSTAFGDRYALSLFQVWDVVGIYRKAPGDAAFFPVPPGEYNVTNVTMEFVELPGFSFNTTVIDFLVEQAPGTEIRADADGIFEREEWNGIPAEMTFEGCRNPMNFFIRMILTFFYKAGDGPDVWDVDSIQDVLTRFDSLIIDSAESSGFAGLKCDTTIVSSLSPRELLGRFQTSFEVDVFQNSHGKIAVAHTELSDPYRPTFKEGHIILRDSFFEDMPSPRANRVKYRYEKNFATDEWAQSPIFNNYGDQYTLGDGVFDSSGDPVLDSSGIPVRILKYEDDTLDLWMVRDGPTATYVTERRMSFLSLGSYRQTFKVPLPEMYANASVGPLVELGKLISITHSQGMETGGYVDREAKIIGLTADLDKLELTIRTILRQPQTVVAPYILAINQDIAEQYEFDSDVEGGAE